MEAPHLVFSDVRGVSPALHRPLAAFIVFVFGGVDRVAGGDVTVEEEPCVEREAGLLRVPVSQHRVVTLRYENISCSRETLETESKANS